jgi:hypothetical protein
MPGRITRSLLPLAALALGLVVAPAASAATHPAQDPVPIGPNEYFKGIFNGHPPGAAMIFVSCSAGASTGHPVAGQKLWVDETGPPVSTNPDTGYTGSKGTSVNASITPSTVSVLIAHFTGYGVKKTLSSAITVPCSGKGTIDFAPAPTSSTAKTAKLAVTFGPPPAPNARR